MTRRLQAAPSSCAPRRCRREQRRGRRRGGGRGRRGCAGSGRHHADRYAHLRGRSWGGRVRARTGPWLKNYNGFESMLQAHTFHPRHQQTLQYRPAHRQAVLVQVLPVRPPQLLQRHHARLAPVLRRRLHTCRFGGRFGGCAEATCGRCLARVLGMFLRGPPPPP